jgi:hypothetical protein
MSVLAQLVQSRESWGRIHREQKMVRSNNWRAVMEFVVFAVFAAVVIVYHDLIMEAARQIMSKF